MRAWRRPLAAGLAVLSLGGCARSLLDPDPTPGSDPATNFEILWREFDRHYSFFVLKGIDWDETYARYRPQVTGSTSPKQLYDVLMEMLGTLQDGHVLLRAPWFTYQYRGWLDGYPANYDAQVVYTRYVHTPTTSPSGNVVHGRVGHLGYIHISDFVAETLVQEFDQALEELRDTDGLVLDIRDNGGGHDWKSEAVAARFADSSRLYRRFQFRNGPAHDDFTPLENDFVSPRGPFQYLKPVAVLTNRRVFSAAESFVLAMRALPHATVIGGVTGGGSGNPMQRELPNGWTYQLSRWIEWTPEGRTYEGVGLAPDLTLSISPRDEQEGRDTILDAAIAMIVDRVGDT
jgi:hypothetical protein